MEKSSGGIGLFTALGLIFIGRKLLNVIQWAWWLVLLPIWDPWALAAIALVIYLVYLYLQRR